MGINSSRARVRTGVVSWDTLIGFILFMGTDMDTATDKQGQVKFLPYLSSDTLVNFIIDNNIRIRQIGAISADKS